MHAFLSRNARQLALLAMLQFANPLVLTAQEGTPTISFTTAGGQSLVLAANADDDEDGIENILEIEGFGYSPATGLYPCDPATATMCYQTDPTQWSTDGDPYSDYMEVSGVNMPAGVQRPYNHPLVAARPVIAMRMASFQVDPLGEITDSNGGSRQRSFTNTTTNTDHLGGSLSVSVEKKLNPIEPVVVKGTATIEYSHTWTHTTSSTSTLGSNWSSARSTNINEAAALTLQVFMENLGSADALDVQPTFNLVLDNTVLATIRVSEDDRANILSATGTSNSRYPRSGTIAIERDARGNPITVSIDELKAIQSGASLALVVTQVNANVIRWNRATQNWDSAIAWTSFENQIDPVTMTVQADLGDGEIHEYEVYAGSAYNAPDYTLRHILSRVFSVEDRDGVTYIGGRKYPGGWYLSSPSPAVMSDWEAAGKPASMMGVHMRPTTHLILQSTESTVGPHVGFATFSSDMRHVFVSAQPHVFPIYAATAMVYVNGRPREVPLVRKDGFPFLTNEVPFEAPASAEAVVKLVDAADNETVAPVTVGALRRDCLDVEAELREDEYLERARRYLAFESGDPNHPMHVYCIREEGVVNTYHYWTPGQISERAFYNAHFIDENNGVVVGQDRWVSITRDGLFTSRLYENHGMPSSIHDAHMVSPDTIRLVGNGGMYAWTLDGGVSWQHENLGTNTAIFGLDFLTEDFGMASGGEGVVFTTVDGGATWTRRDSNTGFHLMDIDVITDSMAVAVGAGGRVTVSRDGGTSWRSQIPAPLNAGRPTLHSVSFLDAMTGLVVGAGGTIARTADGGATWTKISSGVSVDLWRVQFVTPTVAYIAGLNGTVLKSRDGGKSWTRVTGPMNVFSETNYIGMHFIDENTGFVVGHHGRAIVTGSGFGDPTPLTSVDVQEPERTELPTGIQLDQNYPNPFNPFTTITFTLSEPQSVRLAVFDLLGRQVALLLDGPQSPGTHQVRFEGTRLASGTYLYQLRSGGVVETKKMILAK